MFKAILTAILLSAVALTASIAAAEVGKKAVTLTKEWRGSVADEALAKDAPECIADGKALADLWKKWQIADKQPEVDFKKEIVILATTRGSSLNLRPMLDEKGNLQVVGMATRDLRPGFRYVIGTVSRDFNASERIWQFFVDHT